VVRYVRELVTESNARRTETVANNSGQVQSGLGKGVASTDRAGDLQDAHATFTYSGRDLNRELLVRPRAWDDVRAC